MAIAIGMASGTRFYSFALIFTMSAAIIIYLYDVFEFGIIKSKSYVLRIRIDPKDRRELEEIFSNHCSNHFIVSMDRIAGERDTEEIIYETELKKQFTYEDLMNAVTDSSGTISVSLLVGESSIQA